MRVADLIDLLCTFQEGHGPDAQIPIPRSPYQRSVANEAEGILEGAAFGEEIFMYNGNIATYLGSSGPEVQG